MDASRTPLRFLFTHAHPDDETLATGLAMAVLVAEGHEVHLLTCTLGDEGEVIPPELAHLGPAHDDALGPYRRGELRRAMQRLGVRERVLGEEPGRTGAAYRDSGMAGTASMRHPDAFCAAPLERVAEQIRAHVREVAPDLLVTYDRSGGYGHPDHVRTHEATLAAAARIEPARRPVVLVRLTPQDWAFEDRAWLAEHVPGSAPVRMPALEDPYPPSVVDPSLVGHEVVAGPAVARARDAALTEHRTQVSVYDGYYALSNGIAARLVQREGYSVVDPVSGRLVTGGTGTGPRPGLLAALPRPVDAVVVPAPQAAEQPDP